MGLKIYGSSGCAACKTLLKMADAQNVAYEYLVIDQDEDARHDYDNRQLASRELPLVVRVTNGVRTETAGLSAGMSLLKAEKELSR